MIPDAIPALDNEAAPETPALIPTPVLQRGMKPPPMFAAVAAPVTPVVVEPHAGIQAERMPTTMVEENVPMDDFGNVEGQDQQQVKLLNLQQSARSLLRGVLVEKNCITWILNHTTTLMVWR